MGQQYRSVLTGGLFTRHERRVVGCGRLCSRLSDGGALPTAAFDVRLREA